MERKLGIYHSRQKHKFGHFILLWREQQGNFSVLVFNVFNVKNAPRRACRDGKEKMHILRVWRHWFWFLIILIYVAAVSASHESKNTLTVDDGVHTHLQNFTCLNCVHNCDDHSLLDLKNRLILCKLDSFETQTWFFWSKLELHKTQTWILKSEKGFVEFKFAWKELSLCFRRISLHRKNQVCLSKESSCIEWTKFL